MECCSAVWLLCLVFLQSVQTFLFAFLRVLLLPNASAVLSYISHVSCDIGSEKSVRYVVDRTADAPACTASIALAVIAIKDKMTRSSILCDCWAVNRCECGDFTSFSYTAVRDGKPRRCTFVRLHVRDDRPRRCTCVRLRFPLNMYLNVGLLLSVKEMAQAVFLAVPNSTERRRPAPTKLEDNLPSHAFESFPQGALVRSAPSTMCTLSADICPV